MFGSHFVRLNWVLLCCQTWAIHTPFAYNLSRFRSLIFNPFTYQRGLAEPPSHPYSSCTSKAATPPRRALIHQQTTKLPQTTQKPQKRRAQCHHLVSRAMVLQRWVSLCIFLFEFFFLQVVHLYSKLSCCFCVLIWFECLFIHFNRWVLFKIVLEHLFSILCRILDIFVLLFLFLGIWVLLEISFGSYDVLESFHFMNP